MNEAQNMQSTWCVPFQTSDDPRLINSGRSTQIYRFNNFIKSSWAASYSHEAVASYNNRKQAVLSVKVHISIENLAFFTAYRRQKRQFTIYHNRTRNTNVSYNSLSYHSKFTQTVKLFIRII